MITPPRLEYYGDIPKAQTFKGAALQFFSFCCLQIGQSATITRTNKPIDGVVFQATVNKDPYGNLFGVVRINVAISGGETPDILFCTSFNYGIDDGTQVYKKPYPPITQGELYTLNPQTTPYPDYSARATFRNTGVQSYWVDKKEANAISWSYETFYLSGANRKGAKISIQGLEPRVTDTTLWYKEPVFCALVPFDEENPEIQRFIMIYRDRVNFSGTGTTRYLAVYNYSLNTEDNYLNTVLESSFNLTTAFQSIEGKTISNIITFATAKLYGLMSDAKTLIYALEEIISFSENGFTYSGSARVLKYLEFNSDYSGILAFDKVFAETPLYDIYDSESSYIGKTNITETWFPVIDIRDKVRFSTEKKTRTEQHEDAQIEGTDGLIYTVLDLVQVDIVFYKNSWSKNGLVKTQITTGNITQQTTQTPNFSDGSFDGTLISSKTDSTNSCYMYLVTKKDLFFSEFLEQSSSVTKHYYNGSTIETISSTYSFSGDIKSQKSGIIIDAITTSSSNYINEYSYTDNVFVGNFYDDDINGNRQYTSIVLNYMKKTKKILSDTDLKTISITRLPTVITP